MDIKIKQIQATKLVMTPQLIQSIDMLQMKSLDLENYIAKEIEKNPFIEKVYSTNGGHQINYDDLSTTDVIENTVSADDIDIYSQLLNQATFMVTNRETKRILEYMILNIDDAGYLQISNEEIALEFHKTDTEIEEIRQKLKDLEPTGIGARNMEESLFWQAIKAFPKEDKFHKFVKEHLVDVANKAWKYIAESLKLDLEMVLTYEKMLLTLNPRPLNVFNDKSVYISPDVVIKFNQDEDLFTIELQDDYLPELKFDFAYFKSLTMTKSVQSYKNKNLTHYKQLLYSLTRRKETLKNVVAAMLERQINFLREGLVALKPMTMKEIGNAINVHESTVSRAIKHKTIQTKHGVFEMKALFSKNLSAFGEQDVSQAMVKEKIKQWIISEDKYQPLSDQKLVALCTEEGISVSRRTIAKYRQMMGISSSTKRKIKRRS